MSIIFDLDGTLLNTLTDLAVSVNVALKKHGLATLEEEQYKLLVGNGVRVLTDRAVALSLANSKPAHLDLDENLPTMDVEYSLAYKDIKEASIPVALADLVYSDFMDYYAQHSIDYTKPYPGIMELLETLKNNKLTLAVMSNKAEHLTIELVKRYFGNTTFTHILGMREDILPKPNPDGALYLASKLGQKPEDILFVGDAMTDMQAAVAANMTAIGVAWGFRSKEELLDHGASHIVDTAEALASYVLEMRDGAVQVEHKHKT